MDVEELIQAIAREVLSQVNAQEEKPKVFIIGDRTCPKCQAAQKKLGTKHTFLYPDENPGIEDGSVRRIVPYLSLSHMSGLAAGKAEGELMEIVLKSLLAGNRVEVMEFEYRRYAETAPEGLMRIYEGQEEVLSSFGLTAVDLTRRECVRIRKSLVTESDVSSAKNKGANEIIVPFDSRVTPLAVENAKNSGITISRR